jgi:hypothetical protein
MITPTLINNIKWKAYLIFMATNFMFIPLVYFCYPETSNLTLEEIDWLFLEKDAVKASLVVSKRGWGEEGAWARHRAVDQAINEAIKTEDVSDVEHHDESNNTGTTAA